jgi:hypothetical protein
MMPSDFREHKQKRFFSSQFLGRDVWNDDDGCCVSNKDGAMLEKLVSLRKRCFSGSELLSGMAVSMRSGVMT